MSFLTSAKQWAFTIRRDVMALWIAARDPRVPWYAKATAGVIAAYALSPIDLIPDFIPIIGYLDDLIIVPLGVMAAIRMIPVELMAEFRDEATRLEKPVSKAGMVFMVVTWIASAALLLWLFWPSAA